MASSASSSSTSGAIRRVGLMTSGGDCPGQIAVIRAVIAHARLAFGWQVLGIPYGTHGLVTRQTVALDAHTLNFTQVDPLLYSGGTVLKSLNKPFPEDTEDAVLAGYRALELDALIVIGGDGSQRIIRQYAIKGNWRVVGVPKTIDNDVGYTGISFFTSPLAPSHNQPHKHTLAGWLASQVSSSSSLVYWHTRM